MGLARSPRLGGALLAVLSLAVVAMLERPALAAWAQSTDCRTHPTTQFCPDQTVCIMGDSQYTCSNGLVELPGVDVYIIPAGSTDPFAGPKIHIDPPGVFGDFWGIEVMTPPLSPGTYDIVLDEHCNGVWEDGVDAWEHDAFTVAEGCSCESAAPGTRPAVDSRGRHCFEACGIGCIGCTVSEETVCRDVPSCCQHCECKYTKFTCPTHPVCQLHDDCYSACDDDPGPYATSFECRRYVCDQYVASHYRMRDWLLWIVGKGPSKGTVVYTGSPKRSGPFDDLCSGPCN